MAELKVLLASPRSFCAGVDRAIETVKRALDRYGAPVYVRRQIVHNLHVVRDLEARGAIFVEELDEVPADATVVFAAHGVSPAVRSEAADRGDLTVIDATCPLVAKVHNEARRYAGQGHHLVLIGHEGHEEIEGTIGEAPDRFHLVERPEDVARLDLDQELPMAYLTQTTLATDETAEIVAALRERFPKITAPPADDICYATQNRQDAVRSIAHRCDLMLVVGSSNSSNTARLVEVARRQGCRAELIEDASELQVGWLDGVATVGLTAGASARCRSPRRRRQKKPSGSPSRSRFADASFPRQHEPLSMSVVEVPRGSALAFASSPAHLREMSGPELESLAQEIRRFLVASVAATGGHLGSNLGVVELTIALHRVFESPTDAIVWDTGHQAYVHKLVTGRQGDFEGLRQGGGLSGYPNRSESEHDFVENSHASTALSYAHGLASARRLRRDGHPVVAVVGDGALTGGLAYEALNNIGVSASNVIVVLNDNGRSYAPTITPLSLAGAVTGRPSVGAERAPAAKFFEALGLSYVGPVDGHDVHALEIALEDAAAHSGPVVVHAITRKGRGYGPAERDQEKCLHDVGPFDAETGKAFAQLYRGLRISAHSRSRRSSGARGHHCRHARTNRNVGFSRGVS
jgi:4-hydroxy-3-methylbut-2-enyl diphosphate reductase